MKAEDHLTIAYNYLQKAQDLPGHKNLAVEHAGKFTSLASDHIEQARALNPKAKIPLEHMMAGVDDLIFDALRIQGHLETRHGERKATVRRGMTAIRTALKYRPSSVTCHLSLAIGHRRLKEQREYEAALEKLIELDPTHQHAHELKDGLIGFDAAEHPYWLEQLIEYFSMWQTWLLFPLLYLFYCAYRAWSGFYSGDPEAVSYFWWAVIGFSSIPVFNYLRQRWAAME